MQLQQMTELIQIIIRLICLRNIHRKPKHVHRVDVFPTEREGLGLLEIELLVLLHCELLEVNRDTVAGFALDGEARGREVVFVIDELELVVLDGKGDKPGERALLELFEVLVAFNFGFGVVENIGLTRSWLAVELFPVDLILKLVDFLSFFIQVLDFTLNSVPIVLNLFPNKLFPIMVQDIDIKLFFSVLILESQVRKRTRE